MHDAARVQAIAFKAPSLQFTYTCSWYRLQELQQLRLESCLPCVCVQYIVQSMHPGYTTRWVGQQLGLQLLLWSLTSLVTAHVQARV